MKKLNFNTFSEALDTLSSSEKGNYYVCNCPECGEDSAFIYKSNISYMKCNRENNCGAAFEIVAKDIKKDNKSTRTYQQKKNSPKELKVSEMLYERFIEQVEMNPIPEDFTFRGINKKSLEEVNALLLPMNEVYHLNNKKINRVALSKLDRNQLQYTYNIVFPFTEKTKENKTILTRLVYRNTRNEVMIKEYNKSQLTSSKDVLIKNDDRKNLIVSESVLDGLSTNQMLNNKCGSYFMRGVGKNNSTILKDINNGKYNSKTLILALDNDRAGIEAQQQIIKACEKNAIPYVSTQFALINTNTKDMNEMLEKFGDKTSRNQISNCIDLSLKNVATKTNLSEHLQIRNLENLLDLKFETLEKIPNNIVETAVISKSGILNALLLNSQIPNSSFKKVEEGKGDIFSLLPDENNMLDLSKRYVAVEKIEFNYDIEKINSTLEKYVDNENPSQNIIEGFMKELESSEVIEATSKIMESLMYKSDMEKIPPKTFNKAIPYANRIFTVLQQEQCIQPAITLERGIVDGFNR